MKSDLSLNQIECALAKYFDTRKNIIVCNVSFGLLDYEADMLILNRTGYLTEIEIKRSLSDLKADFGKKHKHDDKKVKEFYYCIPDTLLEDCIALCHENKQPITGIITYTEDAVLRTYYRIALSCVYGELEPYFSGRKLFLEEQLQLARLGVMRMWNYKNKE
jgi:hypothetical protein